MRPPARSQATAHPPSAIGDYLRALADPSLLLDHDTLQQVADRLADADLDPAIRLELLVEQRRLSRPEIEPLAAAFSQALPQYLADKGLTVDDARDDLLEVGVPPGLLDRISQSRAHKRTGVSVQEVAAHARSRSGEFTLSDVQASTGASAGTARKAIKQLLDAGHLTARRGRPVRYARA